MGTTEIRKLWVPIACLTVVFGPLVLHTSWDSLRMTFGRDAFPDNPPVTGQAIRLKTFEPNLDLQIAPTAEYLRATDDLPPGPYRLRTDAAGFIRSHTPRPQAPRRIVFLGGSTTECLYMNEEERFPSRVADLLSAVGPETDILNAGISGANTLHMINLLLNKVVPLKPDVVVLMENINDLATQVRLGGYWNQHPSRSHLTVDVAQAGRTWPFLSRTIEALKSPFVRGRLPSSDEFHGHRSKPSATNVHAWSQNFARNLRTFIGIATEHGVRPVLMTQFSRFTRNPDALVKNLTSHWTSEDFLYSDFLNAYETMNETIRKVSVETRVPLIDLDRKIPPTREYIYDAVHLNARGSGLVADLVARQISESLGQ